MSDPPKRLTLSLFVFGVFADDANRPLTLDDFALVANTFD
jgi:hypothetical protein